jgi:DNA polymerase-3 subunit delta
MSFPLILYVTQAIGRPGRNHFLSTIGYRDLYSGINNGKIENAYLLSGLDRDRKARAIAAIESALRTLHDDSLAVIRIQVDETSPEDLSAQLLNIPLFETAKMIVIPRVEGADKKSRDILLEYVQSSPEGTCLVATTDLSKKEYTRKGPAFLRKLGKRVTTVDFSPPREKELRERARELARELGLRIERNALEKLLTMTGSDFEAVRQEMMKLSLYMEEGDEVGLEEVNAVISRGGEVDVWELAEAISRRDISATQRILHYLLVSGERPVQIVGALWYQMARMAWCKEMLDAGQDDREIAKRLNVQQWMLRSFLAKSNRFSREEYHTILDLLFELDLAVRSRGRDIEAVFSRSVAEMLCGTGESGLR